MNFARLRPTYISLSVRNNADGNTFNDYSSTTSPDSFIDATVKENYNQPVIDNASNYVVAVERFDLSANAIPFYSADSEIIYVVERANTANTTQEILNNSAYSLSQLLTILNAIEFTDPTDATGFNVVFTITKDGFISLTLLGGKQFDDIYFIFPRKLNLILGLSTAVQTTGNISTSSVSRLDLGDNLQHIVLTSNLLTVSDVIGNVASNVLTDFSPTTYYSNSLSYGASGQLQKSGFTTNLRDKLTYNPNERRYLDLISSFNIQTIEITAQYTDLDGIVHIVQLPFGGIFEIKLGFYRKE